MEGAERRFNVSTTRLTTALYYSRRIAWRVAALVRSLWKSDADVSSFLYLGYLDTSHTYSKMDLYLSVGLRLA